MSMFRRLGIAGFSTGAGGGATTLVQVLARTLQGIGVRHDQPGGANAWILFNTTGVVDGYLEETAAAANTFVEYNWLASTGGTISAAGFDNTLYDIRYVRTDATGATSLSSLANNTWYNLNTNRLLYLVSTVGGTDVTFGGNIDIKYNANSTIISTASCTWTASNTAGGA